MKNKMRKRIFIKCLAVMMIATTSIVSLAGCTGGDSSGSGAVNEKDMNDLGYYKKNGKWYYQGGGAN